jgi:hypothetical protein
VSGRSALCAVLFLVLVASCSLARPTVGLAIAGTNVPGSREGSYCRTAGCSSHCADGPAPVAPLTAIRVGIPVRLDFTAGGEVTTIHGDIWRGEAISGQPIESFDLVNGERYYTTKRIIDGRYYIRVSLRWSRLLDSGDTGVAFLVEIVPP